MNAAVKMQSCPGEEVLAAFIDQRLDSASRLEVVQHLAECGECRDMVVAANEYRVEKGVETENVVRGSFGPRVWVPLAAAAVLVGVLFGVPSIRERILGDPMEDLVAAANGLPKRPAEARLSADFAYRDHSTMRGSEESPELPVEIAALEAAGRARDDATAVNLHAAGVGQILTKHGNDAVSALEHAAKKEPGSAAIWTDLSAAYLVRGLRGDYERALTAATRAWSIEQTPAAAWNRALALQRLERNREAIEAWNRYLQLDGDSAWAHEVRTEHLESLR